MEKKTAVATAGAVALSLAAAAVAVAANFGLLGFARGGEPAGKLNPVDASVQPASSQSPEIVTVYVDGPPASQAPADQTIVEAPAQSEPQTTEVVDPAPARSYEGESDHEGGEHEGGGQDD